MGPRILLLHGCTEQPTYAITRGRKSSEYEDEIFHDPKRKERIVIYHMARHTGGKAVVLFYR